MDGFDRRSLGGVVRHLAIDLLFLLPRLSRRAREGDGLRLLQRWLATQAGLLTLLRVILLEVMDGKVNSKIALKLLHWLLKLCNYELADSAN